MISHHDNSSLHILPLRWHSCDALLSQLCRKSANYFCRTLLDRNVRFWHFRERFESFIAAVIRVSAVAGKKCVDILTMNQNSSLVDFWSGFILDNWSLSRLLVDFCLDFWSTFVSTFGRFLSIWPLVGLTSDRFWPSIDFYTLDCCRFHLTFGLWLSRSPTGRFLTGHPWSYRHPVI